jgi:hypothetical protein
VNAKLTADRDREIAQQEAASLKAELHAKIEELGTLREGNAMYRHAMDQQLDEKFKEAEDRLSAIAKQEVDLDAREAKKSKRRVDISAEQEFLDAVEELGALTERAVREMRNLVVRKSTPQQAFDKWYTKFGEPNIQLVKLRERIKKTSEKNAEDKKGIDQREKDFTQRVVDFEEEIRHREREMKEREGIRKAELEQAAVEGTKDLARKVDQHEKEVAQLAADRQTFKIERAAWHDQQANRLEGDELKAVERTWLTKQENEVRPQLLAEIKQNVEQEHREECEKAKEDGRRVGYEKGTADGFARGKEEGLLQNRAENATKLEKEREKATEEGVSQEYPDAGDETMTIKDLGTFLRAFHSAMLISSDNRHGEWRPFWDNNNTPNCVHPYWQGRLVARFVLKHDL